MLSWKKPVTLIFTIRKLILYGYVRLFKCIYLSITCFISSYIYVTRVYKRYKHTLLYLFSWIKGNECVSETTRNTWKENPDYIAFLVLQIGFFRPHVHTNMVQLLKSIFSHIIKTREKKTQYIRAIQKKASDIQIKSV